MVKEESTRIHAMRIHQLGFGILGTIIVLTAIFFQDRPFTNIGTPESPIPHWGVMLNAFCNETFLREIWFGVNLPPTAFTGERILATGVGALAVAALFLVGRLLFSPFRKSLATSNGETWFFSGVLGYVFLSFSILIVGLLGHANLPILPQLIVVLIIGFVSITIRIAIVRKTNAQSKSNEAVSNARRCSCRFFILQLLLLTVFATFYLLATSQPLFEYDALEYHAQGAREIFESGSIGFSNVNVYLNMPLGAEMTYVAGLNLARDLGFQGMDALRLGLIIGKTILVFSSLLTAYGLVCFCTRFFKSVGGGLWSAIIYLSFPNLFEVFSNGLNEGMLATSLFATCYATFLTFNPVNPARLRDLIANATLIGIFAGFAASIKYTGVVFVFIPSLIALAVLLLRSPLTINSSDNLPESEHTESPAPRRVKIASIIVPLVMFVVAGAITCGGWYVKNYVATGNPVYPLCYSVFGDKTGEWNDSINERWKNAHSPNSFNGAALAESVAAVFWRDDFGSPLYIFVPIVGTLFFLGFFHPRTSLDWTEKNKRLFLIFAFTVLFGIAWFLLTHRLTRFLLPSSPLVAILLGIGVSIILGTRSLVLKTCVLATTLLSLFYSGILIDILGQGRLAPLRSLENDPARYPAVALYFNNHPELLSSANSGESGKKKLLLVGDAKACAYRVDVLYSTCWNDSPLIGMISEGVTRDASGKITDVSNASKIKEALNEAKVAYISVDFSELARFRSKGNYGFNNPEIDADLFFMLVQANIIEPFTPKELNEANGTQVFRVVAPM